MARRAAYLAVAVIMLAVASASAEWRMEIESKTVNTGQTEVTLNITYAWDIKIHQASLPVVVRSLDPGAFWAGSLPYDTADVNGNRFSNRVIWNPLVPLWANIILEMRPGTGNPGVEHMCNTDADTAHYDGVSSDHFAVNTQGIGCLSARPEGMVFATIIFDVTDTPGQFEFDTACFTRSLNRIYMIDCNIPSDPWPFPDLVDFNKGVVTIAGGPICDCSHHGDCTNDGSIGSADVIYLINFAFRGGPAPPVDPFCPVINRGDWDCSGAVDLSDIVKMVSYVYRFPAPGPCDPCAD